ncbi:potassium/proton antiporter [Clostridium sp. N37]|uniref:Potassium/proton antiporter n=2 Tax=Clostridiaceae TaxID=31979 RepID=A0ABR8YPC6_9CLOT|nr:potassium/proton antiporter [Clostridium faecium]
MMLTVENILFISSILLFVSIFASKILYKIGVPTLILFLVVGMLAGSDGIGKIYFYDPKIAQFIGTVALSFILFSGGLDTKFEVIKPVLKQGIILSTGGVLITALTVGYFVYLVTDLTFLEGMLLGSIVSSTDAAAVFSILRSQSLKLKGNLAPLLELESGSNDPMAYMLTVSILGMITEGNTGITNFIALFLMQIIIGALLGIFFGKLMVFIINKIRLDIDGLYPVLTISMAIFVFSITDLIGGNGFLAIYISGLILGNSSFIHKKTVMKFFEGQTWLMQIILFITLGLLVFPKQLITISGTGIVISIFMVLVARPLCVFIILSFFDFTFKEKLLISWVGLRGAAPIVFSTYPLLAGIDIAPMIFNIVFFISVTSVLIQGTFLPKVAKILDLAEEDIGKIDKDRLVDRYDSFKNHLFELRIDKDSQVINKPIVDIKFPKTSLIITINRKGKYVTPNGSTILEAGDKLIITSENQDDIFDIRKCIK